MYQASNPGIYERRVSRMRALSTYLERSSAQARLGEVLISIWLTPIETSTSTRNNGVDREII